MTKFCDLCKERLNTTRKQARLDELEEAFNTYMRITSMLNAYVEEHGIDIGAADILDWAASYGEGREEYEHERFLRHYYSHLTTPLVCDKM